ncbi:chloride channel protein [Actinomyces oris]|uniref:Chloride channel protein n=1 Tax=Actinomyces oris TaxID=544580 RepID=A0A1Q8XI01_9ACTO|nr:chloride channel protein [Actinomyces oris]OLO79973.1 chloride channel protein [Actinomyces oris]
MDRVWKRLSAPLSRRAGSLFRHHRFGLYILAVLVGLASGLGAVLFRLGIDAWSQLLSGADDYTVSMGPSVGLLAPLGTWFVLVTPVLSGLLTGPLMSRLGRTPTGHGVAGVIWSTRHGDGTMAPLPALAATTSAALTIGGGGSVGPEGPIAELGASTASIIGRRLRLHRSSIRHLAAAGTAAGIASAFNAPLAGAFFALEVILMGFSADAFIVIVLACVSSTVLSHHLLGTTLSLSLPYLDLSGDAQLGWVALLGAVGGGVGVGFMRLRFVILDALTRAWQRLGIPIWARPGIGGLAVGTTLLILPEMYGESSAALNRALAGRYALTLLLVLCVAKMLATSLTLGMGFVGGVFAPSLFIGGTLGAAFGTLVAPSYAPAAGVFGVIGMGAVFAGAARAPMTAVLLIIEMTGQHALLVPLMLATVLATFISRFLSRGTLFTEELRRRGEDVEDPMATTLLGRTRASRLMVDPPGVLQATTSLSQAASVMSRRGLSALPVVATGQDGTCGELLGCVTAAQLAESLLSEDSDDVSARPATVADLTLVRNRLDCEDEATDVLQALTDTRLEGLPVVTRAGSGAEELVGWVSQRIVIERVYEAQAQARTAAATYTSWGSRLQDRWHSRPVPRRRIGRISRISRVSSRSSRRSRRR